MSLTGTAWLAAALLLAADDPRKAPPEMLGFVDAAELSEFCTASGPEGRDRRMVCLSYVTGAVDQILAEQALNPPTSRTLCIPRDVSAEGIMKEVVAYAGWSKSARGVSGANFVRYALERAYPCNRFDELPM